MIERNEEVIQNVKIGAKLGFGFGLLIVLTAVLGILAITNMRTIEEKSNWLATEYVPEVRLANELERHSLLTMYGMRGYGLTGNEHYYDDAQEMLEEVVTALDASTVLADESTQLTLLASAIGEVQSEVETYQDLAHRTALRNEERDEAREILDEAAASYMKNIEGLLEVQTERLKSEIAAGDPPMKVDERRRKVELINDIIDIGNSVRMSAWKSQANRNVSELREGFTAFDQMDATFAALSKITRMPADIEAIEATQVAANRYRQGMEELETAWVALDELGKQRDTSGALVLEKAEAISTKGIDSTTQIADDAIAALKQASFVLIAGLIVCAVIGIVCAIFITRTITGPLGKGVAFAQSVAEGDLTKDIDISQKDEVGQLADALNGMVERLRSVVGDVKSNADNVSVGSDELSSASQKVSQGSAQQASSIEEVSSSMEEMASNIRQNAENASQTEKIANQASQMAVDGGQAVDKTVSAMNQIAERINIVGEIASQTNLLALNAAIEAARAGEHGKGFAVVASEVRKLAERSQKSAAEIGELSTTSVEVAGQAGEMLSKIVPDIQKTADLVQEISAASREQNAGADQINLAIQQLDEVIQQNASASEEMAATSEELASQADQLQQGVAYFRIDENQQRQGSRSSAVRRAPVRSAAPKPATPAPKPAQARASSGQDADKLQDAVVGVALDLGGDDDDGFETY